MDGERGSRNSPREIEIAVLGMMRCCALNLRAAEIKHSILRRMQVHNENNNKRQDTFLQTTQPAGLG